MRSLYRFLPFFAIAMLLSPTLTMAATCDSNCAYIWHGLFGFDLAWFNNPHDLVINAILPSVAIFAIFLGIMRAIQIGRMMGNMEYVIAIIVTLSALFTGWVNAANTYALAFLGQFSFWAFFFMFAIGVVFYFIGFYRRTKMQSGLHASYVASANKLTSDIRDTENELKKAYRSLQTSQSSDMRAKWEKRIADLEKKLREYETRRNELNRSYAAVPPAP